MASSAFIFLWSFRALLPGRPLEKLIDLGRNVSQMLIRKADTVNAPNVRLRIMPHVERHLKLIIRAVLYRLRSVILSIYFQYAHDCLKHLLHPFSPA